MTLDGFLRAGAVRFYVGITKTVVHESHGNEKLVHTNQEALRWLTQRGAMKRPPKDGSKRTFKQTFTNTRCRPVLRWTKSRRKHAGKPTTVVTAKEAVAKELGFKVMVLYTDPLYHNTEHVENCIQKRYRDLPLGVRLWRREMGCPRKDKKGDVKAVKVFLTYTTGLPLTRPLTKAGLTLVE